MGRRDGLVSPPEAATPKPTTTPVADVQPAPVVRHSTRHTDGKYVSDKRHPATRHIR